MNIVDVETRLVSLPVYRQNSGAGNYSPYTKAAGFLKSTSLPSLVYSAGIQSDAGGPAEMGIDTAVNLSVAAANAAVTIPVSIPTTQTEEAPRTRIVGITYHHDPIGESSFYPDGHLIVPDMFGIGVDVDVKNLAKCRVGG
jgi:hypothetical protein